MGWGRIAAVAALAAGAAVIVLQDEIALAQSSQQGTVFRSRDEDGRVRTKIIIQKRSYLDGGTEVLPGERKYRDYAEPPGYSVTEPIKNTAFDRDKQTMPGPFDLPGKNNPRQ